MKIDPCIECQHKLKCFFLLMVHQPCGKKLAYIAETKGLDCD